MKRPATPSMILLACLFGGFLAGGLRDPLAWTAAAAALWLTAIAFPVSWAQAPDFKVWILWLGLAGLSTMTCDQPLKSVFALSRWLGVIAFFGMAGFHWDEEDRKRWLAGLCLFGLILGLAALFVKTTSYPMVGLLWPYYNYTTFVLAAMFAAALGALGHSPSELKNGSRWALRALMAFALAVILLARSRGGLWAIAAALALWMARHGKGRLLLYAALALTAAAALMPAQSAIYLFKLDKPEAFKRPQLWEAAVQISWDHPIFGEGPGNFEQGFMRHNFASGHAVNYGIASDHAHSEPLEIAAETGWVGLAIFLAALMAGVRRFPPTKPTLTQEAGLCAFTAMAAQCAIDNMLHMPSLALLFFSALACAQGAPAPQPPAARENHALWRLVCLGGLIMSLAAWVPRRIVQTSRESYQQEKDPLKRLELARRCARLFPQDYYHHEMLARAWLGVTPPHLTHALEELERASRLNPTNALYPEMRAELMRAGRRWGDVAGLAGKALELEPNYQEARLLRAEAWARTGNKDSAKKELAEILERRARLADAVLYPGYDRIIVSFDKDRYDAVSRLVH